MTDRQTNGQMDRISTCRLDPWKGSSKNLPGSFNNSMVKTARNLVGHQIGWWLWWQLWWRIWWFTNFVDKFDDLFWSPNLSPNLSLNSSQYSSPNISPNFANQLIFHQIFHQNHHPISWPTKCGDENDIKIITQFGESPNKVTNMSPNSSPNLVITKFVTKFITKFVTKDLGDLYVCSDPFHESRVDDGLVEGKNYICFFKTWRK